MVILRGENTDFFEDFSLIVAKKKGKHEHSMCKYYDTS